MWRRLGKARLSSIQRGREMLQENDGRAALLAAARKRHAVARLSLRGGCGMREERSACALRLSAREASRRWSRSGSGPVGAPWSDGRERCSALGAGHFSRAMMLAVAAAALWEISCGVNGE